MFGWRVVKVVGASMEPTLTDGAYALAREYKATALLPAAGHIAVVRHPVHGLITKRVIRRRDDNTYELAGDGIGSIPAVDLKAIPFHQIEARIVRRLARPWRRI